MESIADSLDDQGGADSSSSYSNFDRWCLDNLPPDRWSAALFTAYLRDEVPPSEWTEWNLKRLPGSVRHKGWSDAETIAGAYHRAAPLLCRPTKSQFARIERKVRRLMDDPAVMAERDRLITAYGRNGSALQYFMEAEAFAANHSVGKVPPADVSAFLASAVTTSQFRHHVGAIENQDQFPGTVTDSVPNGWVNILPQPIEFVLPADSVAIILQPGMTKADINAVWPAACEALGKMERTKGKGGRRDYDDAYRRASELKFGQGMTWRETQAVVKKEFGERSPDSHESLAVGTLKHRRNQGNKP